MSRTVKDITIFCWIFLFFLCLDLCIVFFNEELFIGGSLVLFYAISGFSMLESLKLYIYSRGLKHFFLFVFLKYFFWFSFGVFQYFFLLHFFLFIIFLYVLFVFSGFFFLTSGIRNRLVKFFVYIVCVILLFLFFYVLGEFWIVILKKLFLK